MVEYGPVWSCTVLYGSIWTHMAQYGPICFLRLLMFAFLQLTQLLHCACYSLYYLVAYLLSSFVSPYQHSYMTSKNDYQLLIRRSESRAGGIQVDWKPALDGPLWRNDGLWEPYHSFPLTFLFNEFLKYL